MFRNTSQRTSAQLQDDIMRFEGRFSSQMVTAFAPLVDSPDAAVRLRAGQNELAYISAALDIAVGAEPEVDVLDMVTLVALGKDATTLCWSVESYGDAARGIVDAFQASLEDILTLARQVISPEMETELFRAIGEWQRENPDQENVASVRLSAHSAYREGPSSASTAASGLFSAVRGAAQTADSAVLLGERALYAAQRLPFFVRMHARIGSTELMTDLGKNLETLDFPLSSGDQNFVLGALAEARSIVASAEKSLGTVEKVLGSGALIADSNALVGRTEQSMNRVLRTVFFTGSGLAIVAAASWLFARLANRRLAAT